MFVSGGNHAGKMTVAKNSEGQFYVAGFDAVGDGSEYLPTAISEFVKKNNLTVKYYKDYGWPAVQL